MPLSTNPISPGLRPSFPPVQSLATMRITTFGQPAIRVGRDSRPNFASRKAEALLIYLACNRRTHSRARLADLLWDNRSERRALSNLRVVLSSLRKEAGPFVSITPTTVRINPEAVWLDAGQLEAATTALHRQRTIHSPEAADSLADVLTLYEDDFLEDYSLPEATGFESWATVERERLHRLMVNGLQRLGRWYLEQGAYFSAIHWASRLVTVDKLAETGHRQLMEALTLSGRRTEALRQYQACRRLLQAELGVRPSAATRALNEAIRTETGMKAMNDARLQLKT